MSDISFPTSLSLEGRYEPDDWDGQGAYPHDAANPVTGMYVVGFNIGGVFRPIAQFKASGLYADIQRLQAAQQAQSSAPSPEPTTPQ
jgi:hypothetical protein